jgi:hypothetical protein
LSREGSPEGADGSAATQLAPSPSIDRYPPVAPNDRTSSGGFALIRLFELVGRCLGGEIEAQGKLAKATYEIRPAIPL